MNENINFPNRNEYTVSVDNLFFRLLIDRPQEAPKQVDRFLSNTLHIHSHIELFVCTRGVIYICTENGDIELLAGDAAIIPVDFRHTRLVNDNEEQCEWCCINFVYTKKPHKDKDCSDMFSLFDSVLSDMSLIKITARQKFCEEITAIVKENAKEGSTLPALRVVTALCSIFEDNAAKPVSLPESHTDTHTAETDIGLLYKLNHIINSCFMNDLTNAAIAEMLFISERQLSRIALKHYGMSIRTAITDRRLVTAEKLLAGTDETVESIGSSVGYNSKSGFYRDFRKKYGITPIEYRKAARQKKEKPMPKYKIVATDLDGTLLNNSISISNENVNAIKELNGKGVLVVPSTGRSYSEIPEYLKNDENIRYYITSNGAVVFDKKTGDKITSCMSRECLKGVLDIIYSYETHLTYRHNGDSYVDKQYYNKKAFNYYNIGRSHERVVEEFAIPIDNFKEAIYSLDDIEVIAVFFHSEEERLECKERLAALGSFAVVEAWPSNLEIANIEAGKGNALYKLCDKLGIDYAETIAVGDSDNDSSIVEAAGLGLAVSNARESLKELADAVICSNEEHAMDYILKNYTS
ncbi:MAG: Cof-type HAD-IIB family hydrolase [Clostridia bacterium]|nr:Cof-type HAD-IIB family hydrolase [Clostridia bacterium]